MLSGRKRIVTQRNLRSVKRIVSGLINVQSEKDEEGDISKGQINNIRIRWNSRLEKWQCFAPNGRVVKELATYEQAERWALETHDFLKAKACHWYAAEWAQDRTDQIAENLRRLRQDIIREFPTQAERDAWVAQGTPQRGKGYRVPLRADGWQVRDWKKRQAKASKG